MPASRIINKTVKLTTPSAIMSAVIPTIPALVSTIDDKKRALRLATLERRNAITPAERAQYAVNITKQLIDMPDYRAAKTVMGYMSFGSEFDTVLFVEQILRDGKRLALPRVDKKNHALVIHQVDNVADLQAGVFGIREPRVSAPLVDLSQLDFILVPGLAFDRTGMRLGYGAGFYDQLLARENSVKSAQTPASTRVSAAFSTQIVDAVPSAAHDQRIHFIITENEQIKI